MSDQNGSVGSVVMHRFEQYRGVTYPTLLIRWGWQYWIWRRLLCRRQIHLFDEVLSSSGDPWSHYLHCDACGLEVHIECFNDEYVEA